MKTSRAAHRFKRGKRELIWVTVTANGSFVGVTTTPLEISLVLAGDWEPSLTGYSKGATFMGARGWYQFAGAVGTTGTFGSVFGVVVKQDADEPLLNWNLANAYNEADVLHTFGATWEQGAAAPAAATPYPAMLHAGIPLEIKTKRKLNSADMIGMYITTSTAATDFFFTGVFRSLIALP